MKQKFSCFECDAFGTVIINNEDQEYYEVVACPACGAELNSTSSTDEDDE